MFFSILYVAHLNFILFLFLSFRSCELIFLIVKPRWFILQSNNISLSTMILNTFWSLHYSGCVWAFGISPGYSYQFRRDNLWQFRAASALGCVSPTGAFSWVRPAEIWPGQEESGALGEVAEWCGKPGHAGHHVYGKWYFLLVSWVNLGVICYFALFKESSFFMVEIMYFSYVYNFF